MVDDENKFLFNLYLTSDMPNKYVLITFPQVVEKSVENPQVYVEKRV